MKVTGSTGILQRASLGLRGAGGLGALDASEAFGFRVGGFGVSR